ncbi:MAG: response regulator [Gemmatimonadetes bacterium]|nr:response regulator [Gemmatimonadota bacterium]
MLLTSGELGESAQVAHGADVLLIKPAAQEDLLRALRPVATPNATTLPDTPPVSLGLHVLVAEDEPVNQMVIAALLERLGCTVVTVGDGSEAVSRATTESFDAILMDFHMPEMDGVDATREIRAAEATAHRPRVPIVALTALATEDARLAAIEAGMDHFLTKPVDPCALQHRLETCAPHAGAAAPASTTA